MLEGMLALPALILAIVMFYAEWQLSRTPKATTKGIFRPLLLFADFVPEEKQVLRRVGLAAYIGVIAYVLAASALLHFLA